MENATVTNLIPVVYSAPDTREFLTVDCPEGWDDVKKICKKVLEYKGRHFTFTCWNSDRNCAYFRPNEELARIKK